MGREQVACGEKIHGGDSKRDTEREMEERKRGEVTPSTTTTTTTRVKVNIKKNNREASYF